MMASQRWWGIAWPGLCATLSGNGFARFTYTALIPYLIGSGQVTPPGAAYLGSATLAAYVVGALGASSLAVRFGAATVLRIAFVLTTLSLAACAIPGGIWWLLPWRILVGATGALLLILGPSVVLVRAAPGDRGRVSGLALAGVGLGTGLGSLIVALLAPLDLAWAWLGLAAASAVAAALSWSGWRGAGAARAVGSLKSTRHRASVPLLFAIAGFGIDGIGFIPHTLFWVDFIARELGQGIAVGNGIWLFFSLGAALGPVLSGPIGDRIGIGRALVLAFAVKSVAIALPWAFADLPSLAASAFLVGALAPGIAALSAARIAELVPPEDQARSWGLAILAFSICQAIGGYGLSYVFATIGHYQPLFLVGAIVESLGIICALGTLLARPRRT
jgi:MFS family permease